MRPVASDVIRTFRCHSDEVPTHYCSLHEQIEGLTCCSQCAHRTEYSRDETQIVLSQGRWNYISTAQLLRDTYELVKHVPADCAGIVGVPRSGMIPASLLATASHLPLLEFSSQYGLRQLGTGGRMHGARIGDFGKGKLFVVDDSVHSGGAMSLVRDFLGNKAIYSTVYCRMEASQEVDIFIREAPSPHIFEWNLFNSGNVSGQSGEDVHWFTGGIAFDFDGIICPDPPVPDADDGPGLEAYIHYLKNAPPTHMTPRYDPVPLIVTLRLEKWREITMDWLRRNRVTCWKLVMCPYENASERNGENGVVPEHIIIKHKAMPYKESKCILMVESDPRQAELIHFASGKPVLCPATGEIFQDSI